MPDKKHKWTDEQKKLLHESIKIWEGLAVDVHAPHPQCPLCAVFRIPHESVVFPANRERAVCRECPVSIVTEDTRCHSTPFDAWCDAAHACNRDEDRVKNAATAERDFLREVLAAGS